MILEHAGRLTRLRVEVLSGCETNIMKCAQFVRDNLRVPRFGKLDRDVRLVVQQVRLLCLNVHSNLRLWMRCLELGQARGDPVRSDTVTRSNRDPAFGAIGLADRLAEHFIGGLFHLPRIAQHRLPGLRQLHAAS